MFLFLSLLSCRKTCDIQRLSTAQSSEEVLLACDLDNLNEFTMPCLDNIDTTQDGYDIRSQIYDSCSLDALSSKEGFALSTGSPLQAAKVYHWLKEQDIENPETYAQHFFTPSPFIGKVAFSKIQTKHFPTISPKNIQRLNENIASEGGYGRYPDWHIPMTVEYPLVLAEDLSIKTLRHIIASASTENKPVQLVFLSDFLIGVPIYPPSSNDIPYFDGTGDVPNALRIRIQLTDDQTIRDLIPLLEKADGKELELALDHRPCFDAPHSMTCLQIENSPRYMDTQPTSEDILRSCNGKTGCKAKKYTWTWAAQICQYQGKRLPTIQEFQAANITGQLWTSSWDQKQSDTGRCADGIPNCKYGTHFLTANGDSVDKDQPLSTSPYCASDNHILSDKTPYFFNDPFPEPPPLSPNPELAKMANSIEHDILEDKGICGEDVRKFWKDSVKNGGRAGLNCRDPLSYVTSNEPWRFVWGHHLKNMGGAYVGVGSDQGYDFISIAKSEWAWVYDYDPNIYRLHKLLRAVILQAQTPEDFVAYFTEKKTTEVLQLLSAQYPEEEVQEYMGFYYAYVSRMGRTYQAELSPYELKDFGWLAVQENYDHIRRMYQQNRIIIVKGDLMGDKAFRSISKTAQEMEVPIRIFYVSNAPLAWGGAITPGFRANIEAMLPAYDENSVYLITHGGGAKKIDDRGRWVYITSNARIASHRISQHYKSDHIMWDTEKSVEMDLRTVGIANSRRDIKEVYFETISTE